MADRQIQNEATLPESNKYVRLHSEVGRNVQRAVHSRIGVDSIMDD